MCARGIFALDASRHRMAGIENFDETGLSSVLTSDRSQ